MNQTVTIDTSGSKYEIGIKKGEQHTKLYETEDVGEAQYFAASLEKLIKEHLNA